MSEKKTPITILQELCMKRHSALPYYDLMADGTEEPLKIFAYSVDVFGQTATGQGKSKKDAKHEAAINILNILKGMNEFKADLHDQVNQQRPQIAEGGDAIGQLLDICVQKDWPHATFELRKACGTAHNPFFEYECRIASLVRVGGSSTKKGAKQFAAQEMLNVILRMYADDNCKQIATLTDVPPSKHVQTYREYKKSDIKTHLGIPLRHRHKFFQNLDEEDKAKIAEIFQEIHESSKERVNLMCRGLKWEYRVTQVPEHPLGKVMFFELLGVNFDMAIAGLEPELYDEILEYVSSMSGIKYLKSQGL